MTNQTLLSFLPSISIAFVAEPLLRMRHRNHITIVCLFEGDLYLFGGILIFCCLVGSLRLLLRILSFEQIYTIR